jgi:hypothetical protein
MIHILGRQEWQRNTFYHIMQKKQFKIYELFLELANNNFGSQLIVGKKRTSESKWRHSRLMSENTG